MRWIARGPHKDQVEIWGDVVARDGSIFGPRRQAHCLADLQLICHDGSIGIRVIVQYTRFKNASTLGDGIGRISQPDFLLHQLTRVEHKKRQGSDRNQENQSQGQHLPCLRSGSKARCCRRIIAC